MLILLVSGCGPSKEEKQIMAAVEDMPEPLPKLYLDKDTLKLRAEDVATSQITHYMYGGSRSIDYAFQLGNEALNKDFAYSLTMAGIGRSSVTVAIILKQGQEEMILGQDEFMVSSNQYKPYSGHMANSSNATVRQGDKIVLRLTVSGSDFGIIHAAQSAIRILKRSSALPAAIAEERKKALIWVGINNSYGLDSDVFTNFKDALDDIILRDKDAEWNFGWGLTKSGKPYSIKWTDNTFSVTEVSMEKAKEGEFKENSVTFKR